MTTFGQAKRRAARRNGYPALARWMALDPDYEGFMFRRFDRLSARNLLHLQSRLLELESKIDHLDDASMDTSLRQWDILVANAAEGTSRADSQVQRDKLRMELYSQLEETLAKYRESSRLRHGFLALPPPRADLQPEDALVRQSQIANLSRPRPRAFDALFHFFTGGLAPSARRGSVAKGLAPGSSPAPLSPDVSVPGVPLAPLVVPSVTPSPNEASIPQPPSDLLARECGPYRSPLLQGSGLGLVSHPSDMLSISPAASHDLLSRFVRNHWPFRGSPPGDGPSPAQDQRRRSPRRLLSRRHANFTGGAPGDEESAHSRIAAPTTDAAGASTVNNGVSRGCMGADSHHADPNDRIDE